MLKKLMASSMGILVIMVLLLAASIPLAAADPLSDSSACVNDNNMCIMGCGNNRACLSNCFTTQQRCLRQAQQDAADNLRNTLQEMNERHSRSDNRGNSDNDD